MKPIHKISSHLLLLLVLISACTDIIDTEDQENASDALLVVEGEITNEPGPYFVKLSTASDLSGLGLNTLGQDAEVIIEDDAGNEQRLVEISPGGTYITTTPGFRGQIGTSYKLNIRLANGAEYTTPFQEIVRPVEISDLVAEFVEEEIPNQIPAQTFIGHQLSATFVKEPGINKFFRVEIDGVLEAEIGFDDCDAPEPGISICYSFERPLNNQLVIFDDAAVGTEEYSVDITRIPATLKRRYLAEMVLKSWSEETHVFWNSVKDQLDLSGSIFDPPLPPVLGNVSNVITNKKALGNFTAAAVSRGSVCFDRSDAPITIAGLPVSCVLNCVQLWSPATFTPPAGFDGCQ